MTNHWVDIKNADLVLIMGGNAAEAHPCGFKWVTEAKAHNKAKLIVVDPRFTRSASVADVYAPIRTGTDIAFLGGVINYLLANDKIQHEYVKNYTDVTFIVTRGLRVHRRPLLRLRRREAQLRQVELGLRARRRRLRQDRSDARSIRAACYKLMKQHYARYTPEMVERVCGTPKDKFLKICEMIASTATPTRAMTIMYALGWTQHSIGSQMIRTRRDGAAAARQHRHGRRRHERAARPFQHPGPDRSRPDVEPAAGLPDAAQREAEQDYDKYIAARALKPLRPNQMSYWQNYPQVLRQPA